MADVRNLSATALGSILRPLIQNQFSLASVKEARVALGITNPIRQIERVFRVVKQQIAVEGLLRNAPLRQVIDPSLFVPTVGKLSKKFIYTVDLQVRDPATGQFGTRTVSILSSRRLRKDTAISQAIMRITSERPGVSTEIVDPDDIVSGEVTLAGDSDL